MLALKEADCSVAMASGSDAARTVSNLVLLDSNFASMPRVVQEGRQSINNLQRSSSLFLVKTIFSALIGVLFIFINYTYPFEPIQQTLISTLTIGVPSFILALETNRDRLKGKFILNVIRMCIPAALTMTANIVVLCALSEPFGLTHPEMSTLAVVLTAFTGFTMLFKVCTPFNGLRGFLFWGLLTAFVLAFLFFGWFFSLTTLTLPMLMILAPCWCSPRCSCWRCSTWWTMSSPTGRARCIPKSCGAESTAGRNKPCVKSIIIHEIPLFFREKLLCFSQRNRGFFWGRCRQLETKKVRKKSRSWRCLLPWWSPPRPRWAERCCGSTTIPSGTGPGSSRRRMCWSFWRGKRPRQEVRWLCAPES